VAVRVTVPPGCTGLDFPDGKRADADRDGRVQVDDDHATTLNRSWYRQAGVMAATEPFAIGTRRVRVCTVCRPTRRWNAWSDLCPRCGGTTLDEEQR
jgi:hypothetical protein